MATQTTFSQAASTQITEAFFNGIGDAGAALAQMEKAVTIARDDVASLRKAAMGGITALKAWDGISDPSTGTSTLVSVDATHSQVVTYSTYLLNVRLPSLDAADVPNLVQESARKLGFAVSNTVVTQGLTQLDGVFSTDAADGSPPVAGPLGHSLRSGNFPNKETSTLDAAGLAGAIALLRAFQDHEGSVFDAALGMMALVVPPALERAAQELVLPAFSGDSLSANYFAGYNIQTVVNPHATSDVNWCLIPMAQTPVHLWLREAPIITTYVDNPTNSLNLRCQMASASYFTPPGWQVITGSAPT